MLHRWWGLSTNSPTIAEHKNLKTILFSPPLHGALYPPQPTFRAPVVTTCQSLLELPMMSTPLARQKIKIV
jgi:hypothetical protein